MTSEIKQRIEQIKNGQVPQGYKKTKVGIVPSEWEVKKLEDLFDFYGGLGISRGELSGKGIPYLHYGDMHKNSFTSVNYNEYLELPKYDTNISGNENYLLKNGDMVFLDASEDLSGTSRCVVVYNNENKPFISGLHTFRAISKNKELQIDFKQYLTTPPMVKKQFEKLSSGFKVYGINRTNIKKVFISYPRNIQEQQKIADILSTQDKVIELKEKLIEEKQKQKKYLMQNLLTGKIRLNGFSGEWKKVKLKNILKERKKYSLKDNTYTHVTLSKEGIFEKNDRYDREHLVKSEEKKYKVTFIDDICYNPANLKFGVICINKYGNGIFSPIYVTFEVKNIADKNFIASYLMRWDFINAVRKYEEGTVYERMAVKPEDFLKFEMWLPPLEEQKAIAEILSTQDKEIELLQKELEEEKQKKKALMQLLLTGIVRV